jgi:Carboxypeptidase regulatory-like domain/TonB dependent receptor
MMRHVLWSTFVLLLLASTLFSQTFRGAINGTVTDAAGAVVTGATVKATNTATAVSLTTTTTSNGEFAFQDIAVGAYKVAVSMQGFKTAVIDNIAVTAGSAYTLPVRLTPGSAGTTVVEVSAAALTLDTTTTTQSDTIPPENLQTIPVQARDFSTLIAVAPGYGGYAINGFGSVNGTRANQLNWQVDGTDNNDFWHNIPAINQGGVSGIAGTVMPIDAIDEFSAQTQSNAETGRNAGGTINVVIKSGTNDLHGSAYYYNRNEYYAATSPFFHATPDFPKPPPLRNQDVGGTIGGPIIKNKTFFFLGFERQNYIFGLTGLATEPSTAWLAAARATPGFTGDNPLSDRLLASLWPSSIQNLPAAPNNYFATVPATGYSYNEVGKIDHDFNQKNHLLFHFFYGQGNQIQPPGASLALATASSNLGNYFEVAPIRIENYSLVWNSVITPRMTNQVLFGISYFTQVFHDKYVPDVHSLGLFTSPDSLVKGQPLPGAPNLFISGFDPVGITPHEGRNDITGHLSDNLSYTVGKHLLRFGGEVRQGRVNEFYFRNSLGVFHFTGAATCPGTSGVPACALADFLQGDFNSASIAVGNAERHVRANAFDFFAQDAWQVTPRLNLNLGLRYDYMGPLHSDSNDLAVFIPSRGLVLQGNGIDSPFPPYHKSISPRVGFAYQPTASERTVVRGAFGIYYDQINMNPFLDFRPPISGADGLQDNPIGPSPVANYSIGAATWQANQYIFPPNIPCPTLSGCANTYNVYSVNQNFRTPYVYNYNLQVEQSLGNGAAVLQVGYVGSAGHRLTTVYNLNQCQPLGSLTCVNPLQAQYPNIGSAIQLNSAANSNYNALQSVLKVRGWHGVSGQLAYTWSHELDTISEYRGVIQTDYTNPRLDYGNGDFDTRQNFTTFLNYAIPGSSHGPKLLTHGWELSTLMTFHGGQPFNFYGGNLLPSGSGTMRPGLNLIQDPFSGVSHSFSLAAGGLPWVNPAAFCIPGSTILINGNSGQCPGTTSLVGNLARNAFFGPGFADIDLSVIKNNQITERVKLQLRAEMYNLYNRRNFASGAGSVGASTCALSAACPTGFAGGLVGDTIGDINGAPGIGPGEPFALQLAAKIIF